jgi:ABC-2 type transport system permease protein
MKPVNPFRVSLTTAWKELQVIFKDRGLLVIIIGLPLVFAMFNGYLNERLGGSSGNVALPAAIVNLDEGVYGQQIADTLSGISALQLTSVDSIAQAEQYVLESKGLAAIVIPSGLSQNIQEYRPSQMQVLVDPTQQSIAASITGILREVAAPIAVQGEVSYAIRSLLADAPGYQDLNAGEQQAIAAQSIAAQMAEVSRMVSNPWIKLSAKTQTGEDVVQIPSNFFGLLVPAFTVWFAFFLVGATGESLLDEKQKGTMRRLLSAPIPRWSIIGGKMLGFIGFVFVQVAILFGVANLGFDMPLGKSPLGLIVLTLAVGLTVTSFGMMLASFVKTKKQAGNIGIVLGFALAGLGGCIMMGSPVPIYKSGGTIAIISRLVPHSHALMGYDMLINQNAGLVAILPQVGILLAYAVVFMLIATWRFKFE